MKSSTQMTLMTKNTRVQHILYSTTPLENEQAGINKVHFELFQQKIKEGRSL